MSECGDCEGRGYRIKKTHSGFERQVCFKCGGRGMIAVFPKKDYTYISKPVIKIRCRK